MQAGCKPNFPLLKVICHHKIYTSVVNLEFEYFRVRHYSALRNKSKSISLHQQRFVGGHG